MDLRQESVENITIVTVPVDFLDGSNSAELKSQLFGIIENSSDVILDLSHVQFIDSTGCGAMLAGVKQLRAKDGDLKLCGITKSVRALFDLIGIKSVMGVFDTREEALASFQSGASI